MPDIDSLEPAEMHVARAAFETLVARLHEIEEKLKQAPTDSADHPDIQARYGAQQQLVAICEYLRPARGQYLNRLIEALAEIDGGRRVQWLEPKRKQEDGQPSSSNRILSLRGRYAGVLEFLIQNDMREVPAAKFVAKHGRLDRLRKPRRNAAPPWEALRDWRNLAMAEPASAEREGFDAVTLTFVTGDRSKGAQDLAKRMLQILDRMPAE